MFLWDCRARHGGCGERARVRGSQQPARHCEGSQVLLLCCAARAKPYASTACGCSSSPSPPSRARSSSTAWARRSRGSRPPRGHRRQERESWRRRSRSAARRRQGARVVGDGLNKLPRARSASARTSSARRRRRGEHAQGGGGGYWKKAKGIPERADPAAAATAAPASAAGGGGGGAVESKSRLRGQGRARPSPEAPLRARKAGRRPCADTAAKFNNHFYTGAARFRGVQLREGRWAKCRALRGRGVCGQGRRAYGAREPWEYANRSERRRSSAAVRDAATSNAGERCVDERVHAVRPHFFRDLLKPSSRTCRSCRREATRA